MFLHILNEPAVDFLHLLCNRPILLTQSCTQFKSPRVKILCVLYLHYNVAFTYMEIPETKHFMNCVQH